MMTKQHSYERSGSTSDQSQKWNAGVLLISWAPSLTTGAAPENSCCSFCQARSWDREKQSTLSVFYLGLGQSLGQGKETSGTQCVCIYFRLLPTMFLFCSFLDERISFLSFFLSSFFLLSSHMCLGSFYLLISQGKEERRVRGECNLGIKLWKTK